MDWIQLAQDLVTNYRGHGNKPSSFIEGGNFYTNSTTISFSRWTLKYGINLINLSCV
jgi:hypothetical protein